MQPWPYTVLFGPLAQAQNERPPSAWPQEPQSKSANAVVATSPNPNDRIVPPAYLTNRRLLTMPPDPLFGLDFISFVNGTIQTPLECLPVKIVNAFFRADAS